MNFRPFFGARSWRSAFSCGFTDDASGFLRALRGGFASFAALPFPDARLKTLDRKVREDYAKHAKGNTLREAVLSAIVEQDGKNAKGHTPDWATREAEAIGGRDPG